jgi:F-type H+-transporting ATPase subunit b
MRRSSLHLAALCAPALLALAPLARAAEEEAHGPDWATLGIALLNFAALLFVLHRFALPTIQSFFFQRSEGIRKQLDQAQSRLRSAEAELAALRQRQGSIDHEAQRLVAELRSEASAERERSLARVAATTERIREDASRVAEREIARARAELRAEAATLAAQLAGGMLREKLRPEDQQRLLDEFVAGVEAPRS